MNSTFHKTFFILIEQYELVTYVLYSVSSSECLELVDKINSTMGPFTGDAGLL